MGVLVVFGGEIHHARCARKTDTTSLTAFSSPQTGLLGRVTEGHATFWTRVPRNQPLDPPDLDQRFSAVRSAVRCSAGDRIQANDPTRPTWGSDPPGTTCGAGTCTPAVASSTFMS